MDQPRSVVREKYPTELRFAAAENDIDALHGEIEKLNSNFSWIIKILVGVFVSTTTAAIVMTISVVGGGTP